MENISMNYGIIPGTGGRRTTQEEESSGQAEMRGNVHGLDRAIEILEAILMPLISVLTPKRIDPSYYERARMGLYY